MLYRHPNVNEIPLQLPLLRRLVDVHRRVEIRDHLCRHPRLLPHFLIRMNPWIETQWQILRVKTRMLMVKISLVKLWKSEQHDA